MARVAEDPAQHIDRYEVRGELGTGGMAVVYRAHDPRLDREVAVKVLHPHLAKDHESRVRFEREARAAARLRHPNIVEVYEFSDAEARESYMVTELLEGPTLRRFAEEHPDVPAEVAAAIGVVLCDALACAHAQGVVHRDVKPDNLMLQRGQLKLTDFGIAHVADSIHMTVTGQVLGSPAHMAPEQIEGGAVDARTDLFAAGTVLYLLAVGRLPFDGGNAHMLLRKILDGEYADPLRVAPAVGHRFAAILRKMLAREPGDRYEGAAALRAELCAFVAEVGWEFPEQELRKYFADPESFVAALKERLKERIPALGQEARRRGDVAEAMGYFNRALALDPGNAKIIALVRSVARRRQVQRALRTAGIIGAAAVATAGLAVVGFELQSTPRPGAVVAQPVVDPEPTPTPVIVRATAHPRAEAPVPPEVPDAGEVHPSSAASPPDRRRSEPAARVVHSEAADASVETREVVLAPWPVHGVSFSVNGGDQRPWSLQSPSLGRFPVGGPLHFVVYSNSSAYERREWTGMITPGEGPLRVRITLSVAGADSAVAAGDGGSSRLN